MDNFEHHLYLYYFNSLNSSPKIQMKFKYISADTVQVNNFLHTRFVHNFVRRHEEYKCWFECQDLWKPIWTYKLYPNLNLYPFLNQILSVFHFSWLLGCVLSIYEKIISFKGKHVDKMIIFYKNGGGWFQADALCNWGYTYTFLLRNEVVQKKYTSMGLSPLHSRVFYLFLSLRNKLHEFYFENIYMRVKLAHISYTHHNYVEVQGACQTSGWEYQRKYFKLNFTIRNK